MRTLAGLRFRPTVATVDLAAVRHNASTLRPARAELMAVVKANGYGHGAAPVARAALAGRAAWLGVALVEEGLELREEGIAARTLVLSELPRGSEREALSAGLTPTLYTPEGTARLAQAARDRGAPVGVHVKVDTGMHRVGIPSARAVPFLQAVEATGVLHVEGLWTHFAKAEELSDPFTEEQLERFGAAARAARAAGIRPRLLHAANSAGVLARPESHLDLVRAGIALYGIAPGPELTEAAATLRPAMSWTSAVSMVKRVSRGDGVSYGLRWRAQRDTTIATVPVGYADGYPRVLSNAGEVLIRGCRRRVAGTVTMDQLTVDCGDDPVEPGDEVVLLGRQGREEVTADELAGLAGTIPYEIVCGVSGRVPREYVGG